MTMLSTSNWRISFFYFLSENDLRDCSSRRISRHLSSRYYSPLQCGLNFVLSHWNFFKNDNKKSRREMSSENLKSSSNEINDFII